MKNLLSTIISSLLFIGFILLGSCSDDKNENDCSDPNSWIGIYTLQSDIVCSTDPSFSIVEEIELEPSAIAGTFAYEGENFSINECSATDNFFTMTKDGINLSVELNGTGCIWQFSKN